MAIKTPVLDKRTSDDIYEQALELARQYCPELNIPDARGYFNPDDPGLVMLKLFSNTTDFLLTQFNKIPDKHRLAFLDFMGIDFLPAKPSMAPLTFYLSEGSSSGFIPSGTQVSSSEEPDITFETTQDLSVIPAIITGAFSLNPWADTYTDHSKAVSGKKEDFLIFGQDTDEKPVDHALYLGDDSLLNIQRPPSELTFHFEGINLFEKYFCLWYDGDNNPIGTPDITVDSDAKKLDITFNDKIRGTQNLQKLGSSSIDGTKSFWLQAKPYDTKIIEGVKLPTLSNIYVDVTVEDIMPDVAFFNSIPLGVKNGFYPFGEEPKKGDTLYIGSEETFSKKGATITFFIECDRKIGNNNVRLRWEYWNGNSWTVFKVTDNTEAFTKSGQILIETCPLIRPLKINGQMNRWIKSRIISEKVYETKGKVEPEKENNAARVLTNILKKSAGKIRENLTENTSGSFKQPVFTPPFIESIKISYSYKGAEIELAKALNNFQYKDLAPDNSEKPYEVCLEKMPAFYLGFQKSMSGLPVALFYAVKEKFYGEEIARIKQPEYQYDYNQVDKATGISWKYFNGTSWKEISVEDETDSFRTGGIVHFFVPSDIKPTREFRRELYWIKVEIKDGKWISCPRLNGIFLNTVQALNSVTQRDEVLGSGNGEANLTLTFSNKPLLEGQLIEVKEESTELKETWVLWTEVKNFTLSGVSSRHYILNREEGTIIFGDGIKGMVPPAGKNNIVARHYRSGGGARGNVSQETITSLKKTIPHIDRVINHIPSSGGIDMESIDKVVDRGPHIIKTIDRAVTREDFEWLAYEASQYVARARCMLKDNKINIIIVPDYEGDAPLPDSGLLKSVELYLKKRAFFTIIDRIRIIGPDYTKINVCLKVKPASLEESIVVSERIEKKLKIFLHPLKGGPLGRGWDFGQTIFISEIAAALKDIEGLDRISEIVLTKKMLHGQKIEEASWIGHLLIEPDSLPFAGIITVEIEG